MKKQHPLYYTIGLLWLLLLSVQMQAQDKRFDSPLSARTANYDMEVYLDTEKHQVQATQTLIFTNPSADTIHTMPFHMYYNAFKNNRTTFMTERSQIPRNKSEEEIEAGIWSWVEVQAVSDEFGNDLTPNMSYIQPDDNNLNDHTVLEIKLAQPVLPYQTYRLQMKWHSQIPKLMIRTGYSRDFYFMVQWYPKLGVYEPAGSRFATVGQWNCHQYHASTEYFGEFGVYNVSMNVPKDFVVAASGFLVKETLKGDRKTATYLAEDVIDFAWTANPHFITIEETWKGIDLKLLIMPEHVCNKERFLVAVKNALSFYESYIEKYPYPSLTIVSPPYHGLFAGAMEYPTLFTAPTLCGLPKGIKTTETLTVHEFTHQYFMQMLSTNEQEEPWMDEGFTSFLEAKIVDKYYPEGTVSWPYMGINISSKELRRGRFLNAPNIKVNPISDFGWHFKHGSYSEIVYGKTAVWLRTLEGILGDETMKAIMKTYFTKWKFKHPGRQNFVDVVNEVVTKRHGEEFGENMNWFLDQAIYGTDECDYAVSSISNEELPLSLGFFENTQKALTPSSPQNKTQEKSYKSSVILYRLGEFVVPQEVLISFDNGEQILEKWDGKARSKEFVYKGNKQIIAAQLDPKLKIPLDKNLLNNSYTTQPKTTGIWRYVTAFFTWLQGIMVTASGLV